MRICSERLILFHVFSQLCLFSDCPKRSPSQVSKVRSGAVELTDRLSRVLLEGGRSLAMDSIGGIDIAEDNESKRNSVYVLHRKVIFGWYAVA